MCMNMMLRWVLKDANLMLFISYFCLYMLLSIASLNVNGLRGNLKRKTVFYFLKQKQYEITLHTKMGSDNPKNLGNKLGRLVETPNLFNWVYLTQFMYPLLPTTTPKNQSG